MSQGGVGVGGASGPGPSSVYDLVPYAGYKDQGAWAEEFLDALGLEFDIRYQRFGSAQARANLLDPTYTAPFAATQYLATPTAAPTGAKSRDTMLDVLLFLAGIPWPADSNLTIAQRQALVLLAPNSLRRKGGRIYQLALASVAADGIAVGWSVPPNNFSIILPDGAPSPGFGTWVQPTNATSDTARPWVLSAIRNTLANISPGFVNLGVGFSQFRAGYSSAGETVFPIGARINILAHEHFDAWAAGAPTGWTRTGAGTLTQSTSAASINWEFTGNAAVFDLTAAAAGVSSGLSQAAANINNQLTHRFQLDYAYSNAQNVSTLVVQITDVNRDGNTYYWNPTTGTWSTTAYSIVVPPSTTRARFAIDVVPQASSSTSTVHGTSGVTVAVFATSDGTATTKTTYTLYRGGLYEKFSLAVEQAALGERTMWLPLIDAMGWANGSRTSGGVIIAPQNASRTAYKTVAATLAHQPYHPALSGRGFRAHSNWTNLLKGSNDFGADWTLTNATRTANSTISPIVGEVSPTAVLLTATATGANTSQATGLTPTSKTYCGGVWVKKLSADGVFSDVTVSLVSTSTKSQAFSVTQAQGWVLLPFSLTLGSGDVAAMSLQVAWGAASASGQIAVADAYLYDVTANPGVLYPPVVRTPIGSTASSNSSVALAVTAGANVLHPLTQRTLASVVRNSLGLLVVPTFDAPSQPNGVIFDVAQGAAQNRVVLRVTGGARSLQLIRWDNAGNTWQAFLGMTTSAAPAAGAMTWRRDTPIIVRCVWDENSTMLGAGNGSASGTKPGSWAPLDTSVAALGIGNDFASANQFDGAVTLLEVVQLGAAAS